MTRALVIALVLLAPALAGAQTRVTTKQARTAAPAPVSPSTSTSTEGTSKAFARADHQHAVAPLAASALPTCSAASGLEGLPRSPPGAGGAGTGARTRTCVCTSDGAASPTYAWVNADTRAVGTSTTCPP